MTQSTNIFNCSTDYKTPGLNFSVFSLLIFLFFLTSSADVLHLHLYLFKVKLNNFFGFCLLSLYLVKYRYRIRYEIAYYALLLFFSMVISAALGAHLFRSSGYLLAYLIELVIYFILPYCLIYEFNQSHIWKLYKLSFVIMGVFATLQFIFPIWGVYLPNSTQFFGRFVRPCAYTYEPSYYALYMTSIVSFYNVLYLYSSSFSKSNRWLMIALNFFLIISTSSGVPLGYIFLLVLVLFGYFWLDKENISKEFARKFAKITLGMVGLFSFMFFIFQELVIIFFFKFIYSGLSHPSFRIRWEGIEECWKVFLENPFFGVGVGGVGPYRLAKYTNLGSTVNLPLNMFQSFDPTNVVFEILSSVGLVGLLVYCALLLYFFRSFRSVVRIPSIFQGEKTIAIALFFSLVCLIFVLQFNQGLFRNYIWIHAGITLGYLHKITDRYNAKSTISTDEAEEKIKCPA